MIDETWQSRATVLAKQIAQVVSAELECKQLTTKLLDFTFKPRNRDAAEMGFLASPFELIFSVGYGTRFELEPLPQSKKQVLDLAWAIANGGLQERVWHRRIKFEVRLQDGEVIKGRSIYGLIQWPGKGRLVTYAPYDRPQQVLPESI